MKKRVLKELLRKREELATKPVEQDEKPKPKPKKKASK